MEKRSLLFVCKDALFREIMSSLFANVTDHVEIFESTAHNVNDLLNDIAHISPDMILLEESSPLSADSPLIHVLIAKPGRPVIVISQESNWVHVVHWETTCLSSASELMDTIKFI